MMTRGFRIITAALITVFALLSLPAVYAQDYPTRPVTIIVPTGPGGTDIIARLIGAQLAQQLGKAFVIDNRPGAGLLMGTTAAAKAEPRRVYASPRTERQHGGQSEPVLQAAL